MFARLSRAFPQAGGPYAYVHVAFGPLLAFVVAWGYWISIWVGNVSIATAAVSYASPLLPWIAEKPGASALSDLAVALAADVGELVWDQGFRLGTGRYGRIEILPLLAVVALGLISLRSRARPGDADSTFRRRRDRRGDLTLWALLA